jgi:hypothetical protein
MAKRKAQRAAAQQGLEDVFYTPSEPAAEDQADPVTSPAQRKPDAEKVRNVGVSLKSWEWDELANQAKQIGVSRSALCSWLLRYGLAGLEDGSINPEFETVRQLKPPT